MTWVPAEFHIATPTGPALVIGLTGHGLGLHAVPDGYGAQRFALTHIASGCRVVVLLGGLEEILPVATAFADAADWQALAGPAGVSDRHRAAVRRIMIEHPYRVAKATGEPGIERPDVTDLIRAKAAANTNEARG